MDFSLEFLTRQLKGKDIRPSYQRIKVLEYLYKKGGHPTADEIYHELSNDIPSLSKSTIYNTLYTLVDAGLVHDVEIDKNENRFDITLSDHGHFQCKACGMIFNFEITIDQVPVVGLDQFEITQKNVYFKGLCPACSKNIKK